MEIKPENLLSVQGNRNYFNRLINYQFVFDILVGRVVSKNVDVSSFMTNEEYSQYFNTNTIENLILPDHYRNNWIIVPSPYNSIHLGEMFSFYINCTNDSIQEIMTNVTLRIDLQVNNKAISLKELNVEKLDAKANFDDILSYEIKEPQIHVLICTLSFNLAGHERQTCRRYFKFEISKPIDVMTKFYYTEYEEIYLEAMFENLTNMPIQLKNVTFDSIHFDVTSLNYNLEKKDEWIFGAINRLNPKELRQYLFILTPKKDIRFNPTMLNSINAFGKLDIIWYSAIGEKGHIQTSQLEKSLEKKNFKIYIDEIPCQTELKKIFKIKFRIVNFR